MPRSGNLATATPLPASSRRLTVVYAVDVRGVTSGLIALLNNDTGANTISCRAYTTEQCDAHCPSVEQIFNESKSFRRCNVND